MNIIINMKKSIFCSLLLICKSVMVAEPNIYTAIVDQLNEYVSSHNNNQPLQLSAQLKKEYETIITQSHYSLDERIELAERILGIKQSQPKSLSITSLETGRWNVEKWEEDIQNIERFSKWEEVWKKFLNNLAPEDFIIPEKIRSNIDVNPDLVKFVQNYDLKPSINHIRNLMRTRAYQVSPLIDVNNHMEQTYTKRKYALKDAIIAQETQTLEKQMQAQKSYLKSWIDKIKELKTFKEWNALFTQWLGSLTESDFEIQPDLRANNPGKVYNKEDNGDSYVLKEVFHKIWDIFQAKLNQTSVEYGKRISDLDIPVGIDRHTNKYLGDRYRALKKGLGFVF